MVEKTDLAHTSIEDLLDQEQLENLVYGLLMVREAENGEVTIRFTAGRPSYITIAPCYRLAGSVNIHGRSRYQKIGS